MFTIALSVRASGEEAVTKSTIFSTGVTASTHPTEATLVGNAGEIGVPAESANIISA